MYFVVYTKQRFCIVGVAMNENPIATFTRENVRKLHAEAAQMLAKLAESHGLTVTIAGGTFDIDRAKLSFAFTPTGDEAEKLAFARDAHLFGADPTAYGRVATVNRREVALIGFDLGRSRFCVKAREVSTGKVVCYPEDVLHRFFHTGRDLAPLQTFTPPFAAAAHHGPATRAAAIGA